MRNEEAFSIVRVVDKRDIETYGESYISNILKKMDRAVADFIIVQVTDGEKIIRVPQVEISGTACVGELRYKQYVMVEELVRCRDCRYQENCPINTMFAKWDDNFCSYGERRERLEDGTNNADE